MAIILTTILYAIYSAIFPYFVPKEARLRPEPDPQSFWRRLRAWFDNFVNRYPRLARVVAHIRLNYYMPIFCPVLWWRHMRAVNQLLEDIGWIDIDFF